MKIPDGTQALIFDCDGTLADTMPVHYLAWQAALQPLGLQFPEDRFYALGGMPTAKIIQILAEEQQVVVPDLEKTTLAKEEGFLRQLHRVRPVEAVYQMAKAYRGKLPLAVASGGYRVVIRQILEHLQVLHWFDAVVTAEDTPRHKPEPDVFLEAARRLAVPAERCVVFEDTDIGLEAARRAGMHGIDIRPFR